MVDEHTVTDPPAHGALPARTKPDDESADVTVPEAIAEIDEALEKTRWSVTALRYELAIRTDWREQFRARPWPFLAAAFGVGLFLGTRGHPHPSR
jgi:hypothetical protein